MKFFFIGFFLFGHHEYSLYTGVATPKNNKLKTMKNYGRHDDGYFKEVL
jgi:hypothetical protein